MFKQYHKTRQNSATWLGDLIPKIMNLTINAKSTTNRSPALTPTNWFPVQVKNCIPILLHGREQTR